MTEWRYPKIDVNELKMYGEKGVKYTREDMDMIPVDVASLVKIREITKVNDIQVDDEENVLCNQQAILHHLFNKEAIVNEFLLRCTATPSCYM